MPHPVACNAPAVVRCRKRCAPREVQRTGTEHHSLYYSANSQKGSYSTGTSPEDASKAFILVPYVLLTVSIQTTPWGAYGSNVNVHGAGSYKSNRVSSAKNFEFAIPLEIERINAITSYGRYRCISYFQLKKLSPIWDNCNRQFLPSATCLAIISNGLRNS